MFKPSVCLLFSLAYDFEYIHMHLCILKRIESKINPLDSNIELVHCE